MTRPWVAVEAAIRVNHKLVALPSDSARWGWVCILGEAKQQRPAGAFHSLPHLREAAGRFARFIPDYQREHLLETAPDLCDRCTKRWPRIAAGTLVVHDWHVHQVDPGAAKRAKDWREANERTDAERETNDFSSFVDTQPSRALSVSLSTSLSETKPRDGYHVPDDPGDEFPVLSWLAQQGVTINPNGNGFHRKVVVLVGRYGAERVREAMAGAMAAGARGDRAIVFGAEGLLDPVPGARKPEPVGKGGVSAEEAERAFGIVR